MVWLGAVFVDWRHDIARWDQLVIAGSWRGRVGALVRHRDRLGASGRGAAGVGRPRLECAAAAAACVPGSLSAA